MCALFVLWGVSSGKHGAIKVVFELCFEFSSHTQWFCVSGQWLFVLSRAQWVLVFSSLPKPVGSTKKKCSPQSVLLTKSVPPHSVLPSKGVLPIVFSPLESALLVKFSYQMSSYNVLPFWKFVLCSWEWDIQLFPLGKRAKHHSLQGFLGITSEGWGFFSLQRG